MENAICEGRDKRVKDSSTPPSALLKLMKSYDKLYYIHLLCDVCSVVSSLTRTFENDDLDLSLVEPKIKCTVGSLKKKMKIQAGPCLSKAANLASSLDIQTKHGNTIDNLVTTKNKFLF